jgi:hypothetical protein
MVLTSGVSVAWAMVGSRIVRQNVATTAVCMASWGVRFLYVALFEPREYILRQIVLDLVGICQKCTLYQWNTKKFHILYPSASNYKKL